jgi:hypothetical protein
MARFPTATPRRVALTAATSPMAKLLFTLLFACFWNGIVSIFLVDAIEGFLRGNPDWFLAVFLVPFVLIGLGMIGWFFYTLLAMFNPRPFVTVSSNPIPLDDSLEVEWGTSGNVERVRSFRITLEGREEATYTRGTTTTTDKETFAVLDVAKGSGGSGLRQGRGKAAFPAHAMHSFDGGRNKIVWTLRVKGDIPFWPDVDEEFEINVGPRRRGDRA